MDTRRYGLWFGAVLWSACSVDLALPDSAVVACESASDCPADYACRTGLCVPLDASLAPTVVLERTESLDGAIRPLRGVRVYFTVSDADDEPVNLTLQYALRAPADSPRWFDATLVDPTAALDLPATGDGFRGSLVWDALADARGSEFFNARSVAISADGATTDEVVEPLEVVALRLIPVDSGGLAGRAAVSVPFAMGNGPPEAAFAEVSPPTGVVPLAVEVADVHSDVAEVQVQFRVNDLRVDANNSWRPAHITLGEVESVGSSPEGSATLLLWETRSPLGVDPATPDQGVGRVALGGVDIRVRAVDDVDAAVRHYGPWSRWPTPLVVINQTATRVENVTVKRAEVAGGGPIAIRYTLVDEESDPADVRVEFAHDADFEWTRCQEYRQPQSEGLYDLATAPTGVGGTGGVEHTFVWDPSGQGYRVPTTTRLRIRVTDGNNPVATGIELLLANAIGAGGSPANPAPFVDAVTQNLPNDAVFGSPISPAGLATGDFNNDGREDAVVISESSSEIAVLLSGSSGAFGLGECGSSVACKYPTSAAPKAVAVGHFDSDANVDMAVVTEADVLRIFTGDGDGTFTRLTDLLARSGDFNGPVAMTSADFDGDGVVDLALATVSTATGGVLVLHGQTSDGVANGRFAIGPGYTIGMSPVGLVAADLDADGDIDLVTADRQSDAVQVLLNDAGDLSESELYPTNASVGESVVVADFTADGTLDVLIPDLSGRLLVLPGVGMGRFGVPLVTALTRPLRMVTSADFNGDGVTDVAGIPTGQAAAIDVVLGAVVSGRATGTFVPPASFELEYPAVALSAADLNGDGLADVVTGNRDAVGSIGSRTVGVLRARPTPTLSRHSLASPVRSTVGERANAVRVADVNLDGVLDAVAAGESASLRLLAGSGAAGVGDGSFLEPQSIAIGGEAKSVGVEDFNGDGVPDLVVAMADSAEFAVVGGLGQAGTAGANFTGPLAYPLIEVATDLVTGDFTADGIPDVLVVNARAPGAPGEMRVFAGFGDGLFNSDAAPMGISTGPASAVVDDLNGDGRLDVVTADAGEAALFVYLAHEVADAGLFGEGSRVASDVSPSQAVVTDCNGDGHWDLLARGPQAFVVHRGIGGTWEGTDSCSGCRVTTPSESSALAVADINGDGRRDVLVSARATDQLWMFAGLGPGPGNCTFADPVQVSSGGVSASLRAADLNADGLPDIVARLDDHDSTTSILGQLDDFYARWAQAARPFPADVELMADEVDRFGEPIEPPTLSVHPFAALGTRGPDDLLREAYDSGLTAPGSAQASMPWWFRGDVHFSRAAAGSGPTESGHLYVRARLGPRQSAGGPRLGLDLSHSEGLGLLLELPLFEGVTGEITLLRRTVDWRRDAADAGRLPLVGTGTQTHDIVDAKGTWEVLREVDTLEGGTGARFVRQGRTLHIATDRLGVFWVFAG